MAVVQGVYTTKATSLPMAGAEAKVLISEYGATEVLPMAAELRRLFDGDLPEGGAQAIHVIAHGSLEDHGESTIQLGGNTVLDPFSFRSARVAQSTHPFLFLHACEVGNAGTLLGTYAGFAGMAAKAGFSGVVAPVWPVEDAVAPGVTRMFYKRAFAATPVADVLRHVRGHYRPEDGIAPVTPLGYIFYGRPGMILTRPAANGGSAGGHGEA
jgi:CHAT domain-containing protein